jgi:hypothetical protein
MMTRSEEIKKMADEQQQDLVRFLMKELRSAIREIHVFQAAMLNLPLPIQAEVLRLRNDYRNTKEIREIVEMEFPAFDELIEQLGTDDQDKKWQEFLKNYKSVGLPN